jgi:hypothetical protein
MNRLATRVLLGLCVWAALMALAAATGLLA